MQNVVPGRSWEDVSRARGSTAGLSHRCWILKLIPPGGAWDEAAAQCAAD